MGGVLGTSKSFSEAWSISLTFWSPFKVSSKVVSASAFGPQGSESFRRGIGRGDFLGSLLLQDIGYFQKSVMGENWANKYHEY